MASTVVPRAICAALLTLTLVGACGGENPYQAAESATANSGTEGNATNAQGNEFLPERENVTDCIGAVERPNCGSESKGGWRMYLTFGVLIAGMSFIGWRIVRSVRARDAALVEQRP